MIIKDTTPQRQSFEDASHYYYPDGRPCHTVPNKSKPGKTRNTNVGDARKLGLYASVTTILGLLNKPVVNNWRCQMAIMSALTMKMKPDEKPDAFARRVALDAETVRDAAADRGLLIHEGVADYCRNTLLVYDEPSLLMEHRDPMPVTEESPIYGHIRHFADWFEENSFTVLAAEQVVVDRKLRVAGTRDLFVMNGELGVTSIDIKSQDFKGSKPAFYDEWLLQLVAYDEASVLKSDTFISVAINSTHAMPVVAKAWLPDEVERARAAWRLLVPLWYLLKNYPEAL